MQIVHRFTLSEGETAEMAALGVSPKLVHARTSITNAILAFELAESDDRWPAVRAWAAKVGRHALVSTKFSERELRAARWLSLEPDWHHGYPQPAEDFGYLLRTYDLSDYCQACGLGRRQKAAFQMKGEPRWGRRGILQLNWVFDEYFVRPEVWATVFEPRGIGSRPVTKRAGVELQTVVQLDVEEHVNVDVTGLPSKTCGTCGRIKYLPFTRGPFPKLLSEPSGQMVKTKEYFGDGASAFQGVLVSQALARALQDARVTGASFRPVATTSVLADAMGA